MTHEKEVSHTTDRPSTAHTDDTQSQHRMVRCWCVQGATEKRGEPFTEMLNNAIEHSGSKDVRVAVSMNGNRIVFEVVDEGVEGIGQGFADEIFRVWAGRHPEIRITTANMTRPVEFMVSRAISAATNR